MSAGQRHGRGRRLPRETRDAILRDLEHYAVHVAPLRLANRFMHTKDCGCPESLSAIGRKYGVVYATVQHWWDKWNKQRRLNNA